MGYRYPRDMRILPSNLKAREQRDLNSPKAASPRPRHGILPYIKLIDQEVVKGALVKSVFLKDKELSTSRRRENPSKRMLVTKIGFDGRTHW